MNKIRAENARPGTPATEWAITGAGDASIQGFSTDISVNRGGTVRFKIQTDAAAYRLDVYRMGYYGGAGARAVATVLPSAALPQIQPPPAVDPATGLIDYGTWAVSASWDVPADATSGIYFAKLVRTDGVGGASHVYFVVRDDAGRSAVLFQTADTTWHGYNEYGGNSLYVGAPVGRAYKVSYNRPIATRGVTPEDGVFNAEYPMVRWLEANGYDVSYWTGVDSDRLGAKIVEHRVFMSVGHDEYWSGPQRAHVEAARDAGVHLVFLSGNEVYWRTRWESSVDGSDTPYRTLVCYKETQAHAKIDPTAEWTGTWRDPRFTRAPNGASPENALTGTMFGVQGFSDHGITVSAVEGRHRFWRGTPVARLAPGESVTLAPGTLGYEWDEDVANDTRPAGLMRLSTSVISTEFRLLDHGAAFGPGRPVHHLTLYRHRSGALVFGAGTAQWSWGLDDQHDAHGNLAGAADASLQQAMVNVLADMGVRPTSPRPGLVATRASTDATPPVSTITAPASRAFVQVGAPTTITGTARDAGGIVAAVEVSVDGGATWRPAEGRERWSFAWTPPETGAAVIMSRAVDDSGNLERPSLRVTVAVGDAADVGPGGPIMVIVDSAYAATNPFGNYLTEILRAEGLAAFERIELSVLTAQADPLGHLRQHSPVLLAETRLSPAQRDLLREYVRGGGRLIAMRPDPELADLFGLAFQGRRPDREERPLQFMAFDTTQGPGVGLSAQSLQYHGDADDYALAGATALGFLWNSVDEPSTNPAITRHRFGAGQAAAWTFDLARSVVLTRQGNPAWKDSESDGVLGVVAGGPYLPTQYRPLDMFARFDGRMWFERSRLRTPQADEQQRCLANLILAMAATPLPRLWYLPNAGTALIVNTGDACYADTQQVSETIDAAAAAGGTFSTYLLHEQVTDPAFVGAGQGWRAAGHEVAPHVYTSTQTRDDLRAAYGAISAELQARFQNGARTARNHTIEWLGWTDMAKIEAEFGTRLDLNYYHYWNFPAVAAMSSPPHVCNLPTDKADACGYFTGSGLAQRFCDERGVILPIYQLATEWVDEFFDDNSAAQLAALGLPLIPARCGFAAGDAFAVIQSMIEAAAAGYTSAFVTNVHPARFRGPLPITREWAGQLWEYARERGIRMCSAERFLDFVEARWATRFERLEWAGSTLSFDVVGPADAAPPGQGLTVMLPGDGLRRFGGKSGGRNRPPC